MGEYDAGYENYIDGLHREIIDYQIEVEQVKVDNAKLVMKLNAEHLVRQNVERENAELRELVRIAGTYCVNGMCGKDDGCPLWTGKPYCLMPQRMRELGVDA